MKNISILLMTFLSTLILILACRPPELEQAVIDYNGNRFDQAYEAVKRAVEKYPNNAEAWYYYGEIAGKKDETKVMVDAFNKSLELAKTFSNQIENSKDSYYTKFYNKAVNGYNAYINSEDKESEEAKEKLTTVIADFEKALLIKPDYQANKIISSCYANLKDDENRLKYLINASEVNPDTAVAFIDLGLYYLEKKDFETASNYFQKAIDIDPNNVDALTLYAQCQDFSGNRESAIEAYIKAIEVNPQEKAIPFNLGLLLYKTAVDENTAAEEKPKYFEDASGYFQKSLDLDPEIKEVYNLLGSSLMQIKKYEEANKVLLQGTEYFPDEATIWANLSISYTLLNDKENAEKADQRAKELGGE